MAPTQAAEPRPASSLEPGSVIAERYRIEALLGEGGMSVVYRVEHVHMRKPFALKVLHRDWAATADAFARFEREAIATSRITDPHVATATDFGRLPDGSCFLVLEYMDGQTLRSALKRGALEPARALHIARGIVAGMCAAHAQGVVHRDLKPENIMLILRDGDPDFVKVLDFGIARVAGPGGRKDKSNELTKLGAIMGTPSYMSPEQAVGERVDGRADQYALGVILYEMLAGQCPFRGDSGAVLRRHVLEKPPPLPASVVEQHGRLAAIVDRLLAKAPEGRFATAADVQRALDECLSAPAQELEIASAAPPEVAKPTPRDSARGSLASAPALVTGATRGALELATSLRARFRARRRRRRLAVLFHWPAGLVDRFRAWRRRRRLERLRAWPGAMLGRLQARLRPRAGRLPPGSWAAALWVALAVALIVAVSLLLRESLARPVPSASATPSARPHRPASSGARASPK